MTLNPYEAPQIAEPQATPTNGRWQAVEWIVEFVSVAVFVLLLGVAFTYRLRLKVLTELFKDEQEVVGNSFLACVMLICLAGARGLYFVARRQQRRAVVNGLLCVGGFCSLVGLMALVMGL